ncbi:2'-5' RNA ligase family protein [Mucilaginibacter xinganensis]|uniref:2'-5' RNA ligase n=1 Tax=Mucilaginibacter xinganensis TaxID=1234841 RepID=A0A223NZB6_9SPHI|nr:2'-5' RNA ligase family protein [Mucilaginibacter xinganensis]ASU34921.1 2'-5' RNA ligase [Mucilaginibacter xinganensis]
MTGYQDYLIVLSPPDSIKKKIKRYKDDSAAIIGEYDSHYSKGHISIQQWPRKKPVWIDAMMPKLERELLSLPPLVVNIKGFDFFHHEDNPTIYARMDQTALTAIWYKQLKRFFSGGSFVPHITIARSIPAPAFKKLWPYLSKQEWNEEFKIDKLTILRRDTIGHDKSYKIYRELPFNRRLDFYNYTQSKVKTPVTTEKPVNTQQFSLF